MKGILAFGLMLSMLWARAQPYLDLAFARSLVSPVTGSAGDNPDHTRLDYFNAGALLPLPLKHSRDAILLSPAFEEWKVVQGSTTRVSGILMPISFLKTAYSGRWSLLSTFIPRWNYQVPGSTANSLQLGGAVIASIRKSETLVLKLGAYYNREFFGNFFIPLVGVDWRIDSANRLFGVLPGNFVFEHRWNRRLSWGAAFRAITNSYRLQDKDTVPGVSRPQQYLRIDDNQLAVYLDFYITKQLVITLEGGHSILRKIRVGVSVTGDKSVTTFVPGGDEFFARAGLAYRMRL
jgi:hypothetical protein